MRSFDRDNFYKYPSPGLRINAELKHNPYVGSFHSISRLSEDARSKALSIHNPHLGTFRHSPAMSTVPVKLNLGFKGLLYDEGPFKPSVLSQISCGRRFHFTPNFLNTLPTFRFSPQYCSEVGSPLELLDDSIPSCAICLENFTDGCELRNLACGHCFHKNCVDKWLCGQNTDELSPSDTQRTCPTCRGDAVEMDSQSTPTNTHTSTPSTGSPSLSPIAEVMMEIDEIEIIPPRDMNTDHAIDTDASIPSITTTVVASVSEQASQLARVDEENLPVVRSASIDIPDYAFMNVGRYLYSSFAGIPNATPLRSPEPRTSSTIPTDLTLNVEEASHGSNAGIPDQYPSNAMIPEYEDDSLLGSTYDLCGVPGLDTINYSTTVPHVNHQQ